jgi:outer membrane murein-binding lipoprotein Lpp
MKRATLSVVLAAVVALAAFAAGGWSAAPPSPTEKKLVKQVKVLQAQVKALRANVKTLQADVKTVKTQADTAQLTAVLASVIAACSTTLTADAFQGTWQVLDQLSSVTQPGAPPYFGPQTPVTDTSPPACQTIGVTRSQAVPPNIAPFNSLLTLLR